MDIFERIQKKKGALGQFSDYAHHYFMFPKLKGEISPHMEFNGKTLLNWSLNNYLGLANHPEVRKIDTEASEKYGLGAPMGSRMMSGNTDHHEELERQLADYVGKESAFLLNFGYQGVMSAIDALLSRHDVVVYDAECHACIIDALRMHAGKRFVYPHNDMIAFEKQMQRAQEMTEKTGGGILVITEGVFGMNGNQGKLKEIVDFKSKFDFRMFVDDAHGFGVMGPTGAGTHEEQDVVKEVDLYFSTFAKSMASIGAFVAGEQEVVRYLMYNMRSQIYAKSLPLPFVVGAMKRLELIRSDESHRKNLWKIVDALKKGLVDKGFNIGTTTAPVTPVILTGNESQTAELVIDLRENFGIFCSAVVYPVVPKGMIILRLIPTAAHSMEDVTRTIAAFEKISEKLKNGEYATDIDVTAGVSKSSF